MGTDKKKARRAARAQGRAQGRAGERVGPARGPAPGHEEPPVPPPAGFTPETWWLLLERAARQGDPGLADLAQQVVRALPDGGDRAAEAVVLERLDLLWRAGWQPREVVRQARRRVGPPAQRLVEIGVHADHQRRPGQALDPRWAAQLAELGGRRTSTRRGWLRHWRAGVGLDPAGSAVLVARILAALASLPPLDVLMPPPGQPTHEAVRGVPGGTTDDDPVLRRVRKLLAKAESTEFEAEAQALTAKAHELVTRHALDLAAVLGDRGSDVPCTVRVVVDAPYADAKSFLLQVVAAAYRCRAVFHTGLDLSSVVGHVDDLRVTEMVFTSLLVQAQHALTTAAASGAGTATRSRSYRSTFHTAFAHRISERLASVTETVMAEAGRGAHLPVLRAREEEVEATFERQFGAATTSSAVRGGWDGAGSVHGRRAADAARLDSGALAP